MSHTVLVIEDSEAIRGLMRLILAEADLAVMEAGNGEEAIRAVQESGTQIKLVICDLHLPDSSGLEVASSIRALQPGAKILYMSGHDVRLPVSDPDGFIIKPFRPTELLDKVRSMIG